MEGGNASAKSCMQLKDCYFGQFSRVKGLTNELEIFKLNKTSF